MTQSNGNSARFVALKSFFKSYLLFGRFVNLILLIVLVMALLAPLIANDKPLFMRYRGHTFFPAFTDLNPFYPTNFYFISAEEGRKGEKIQLDIWDWGALQTDALFYCPIPYSSFKSDLANANFVSPFGSQFNRNGQALGLRFRHWLGTGSRGQDVLAGMIHGTASTLFIGIMAMLIASVLGIICGALAGFYGNSGIRLHPFTFLLLIGLLLVDFFYSFQLRYFKLVDGFANSAFQGYLQLFFSLLIFILFAFLALKFSCMINEKIRSKIRINFPVDNLVVALIDLFTALPVFILIVAFSSIAKPGMIHLIFLLGIFSWTGIARVCRAEFKRIKKSDYFTAARALGYSPRRIMLKHMLKNSFSTTAVLIAFGIANCLLIESSLSFLGIGLSPEEVSWGSLISEARSNIQAWWLIVFPGTALFATVYYFNRVADKLNSKPMSNSHSH